MSKRLASFGGPSAPASSPVAGQSTPSTPTKTGGKKKQTPTSPNPRSPRSKLDVSSVHAPRKVKTQEETGIQRLVRVTLKYASLDLAGWESFSRHELQDAKFMVDQATELDNALGSLPSSDIQPSFRVVTDKLCHIDMYKGDMRIRLEAMYTHIARLAKRANKLEQALTEFVQTNGTEAAEQTPLWTGKTWSLGQHVLHMHKILRPLNRFRHTVQELSEKIIAYGLSGGFNSEDTCLPECEPPAPGQGPTIPTFEETRGAMALWAAEAKAIEELIKEWTEMCALEVVGWDKMPEPEIRSSDEDEGDATD
ncbi:unnamed protein product [Rhizoctonia solani]|uniref:Uncharacterized protein n=1 Tax=Rhizoctonia solani TaxID=456999 RepID=A0A8H3HEK9_9AGAM|nr:unnamed protein product [Rhizoctonia solani]